MNEPRRNWRLEVANNNPPNVRNVDADADFRRRVDQLKAELELMLEGLGGRLDIGAINNGAYTATFELRPGVTQDDVDFANERMERSLRGLRLAVREPTPPPPPIEPLAE